MEHSEPGMRLQGLQYGIQARTRPL